MDLESGAGLLHRLTSYVPSREWDAPADDPRVRHDLVPNDLATIPPPMKSYNGLPTVPLPRDLPDSQIPATAVLAGQDAAHQPLDAAQLGRVLFLGAGVVREVDRGERGRLLFRASGSAGARFPLEVYASTRGVDGVADGVHWYDAKNHALVQVAPAAQGDATVPTAGLDPRRAARDAPSPHATVPMAGLDPRRAARDAPSPHATLIVTGVPWRTGWRYAERGWRHLYWDAGTLLSQLWAVAASAGLQPRLRTRFPDKQLRVLVGADGVHEYPLAMLSFGDGEPAVGPNGDAAVGELPPVEFPLCTSAQYAGERDAFGPEWPPGAELADYPMSDSVDEVILRRGSQRLMDPSRTLPREQLEWPMRAAMRGIDVPHWVVVHGVDSVEPGVYRWPDLSTPIRTGNLREELLRISIGQGLARDAAYVVISAAPLGSLDDRSYREAQLAAGIVEGRLHLAAYALGASACGMTFFDSEVPALLGEPEDTAVLLFTCVGVPEYASRRGGKPGEPATIRMVTPRLVD